MNDDRFVKAYSQGKEDIFEIWVDKQTGVNYLFHTTGTTSGLTVLYDVNGQPVTTNPWIINN